MQLERQEARLMLTNLRDAFIGQSRSPNIVPFHTLDMVSYCAIVTLSLRRAVFTIFDFKNVVTWKTGLGPSMTLEMSPCDTAHTTSCCRSTVTRPKKTYGSILCRF